LLQKDLSFAFDVTSAIYVSVHYFSSHALISNFYTEKWKKMKQIMLVIEGPFDIYFSGLSIDRVIDLLE